MTQPHDTAADALEAIGITVASLGAIGIAAVLAELVSPRAQANRAKLAARRRAERQAAQERAVGLGRTLDGRVVVPFRADRPPTALELRHAAEAARLRRLEADGILTVVDVLPPLTPEAIVRLGSEA